MKVVEVISSGLSLVKRGEELAYFYRPSLRLPERHFFIYGNFLPKSLKRIIGKHERDKLKRVAGL